jgi:nucleotide-binding universal stress UspA family protein
LDVMHVLPPPPLPQSVLIAQAWPVAYEMGEMMDAQQNAEIEAMLKEEEIIGKELLERTLDRLNEHLPGLSIRSTLRRGDAATEMLEYIEKNEIDLVVAGSRGLSQVTGWLLGSVSRKLIHYTGCSVLVVRGQFGCPA